MILAPPEMATVASLEVNEVPDSPTSDAPGLNPARGAVQMGVAGLQAWGEGAGEFSVGKGSSGSAHYASVGAREESIASEEPTSAPSLPKKPATAYPTEAPVANGVDLATMQQMMQMMMTTMQQVGTSGRPLGEMEPNQATGASAKEHQALLDRVEFLEAELMRVKARANAQPPSSGTTRPVPEAREAWAPPPPAPVWPAPGGSASGYATLGTIDINGGGGQLCPTDGCIQLCTEQLSRQSWIPGN